ncbi:MAG: YbaB/EbfC family nucleoid-associated protein [Patescibacteria group bacterium]
MFTKLKQFKEMRDKAKIIQNTLAEEKVEASAAWGKIKMVMNGNQKVLSVKVDPDLLTNKEKMESAIKDVTNEAIEKAQKVMAAAIKKDKNFNFPGL